MTSDLDLDSHKVAQHIADGNPWYVASHFEWAEEPSIRPIYQRRLEYFLRCIERAKGRQGKSLRLLDAGCGDGYWLHRLRHIPGVSLTGVDYNPVRVERCKQIVHRVPVFCCDLLSFEPEQGPFDVIILSQVIEHVQNDTGLLNKMRTLLGKGGVLILGTPNEGSWLHQVRTRTAGKSFHSDHLHFYTENEIRRKLRQAGFSVESVMREVFFVGSDRIYYKLTRQHLGFRLLELLTLLWPRECSDYYFECRLSELP